MGNNLVNCCPKIKPAISFLKERKSDAQGRLKELSHIRTGLGLLTQGSFEVAINVTETAKEVGEKNINQR